jgi:hypothetical protein
MPRPVLGDLEPPAKVVVVIADARKGCGRA